MSAWFVDSAVRWRRNGAGGLRKIVVRLRLFCAVFLILRFCNSLNCVVCGRFSKIAFCNSQNCAGRSLPVRKLAASAFAGLATPQAAFASFRKSARCLSSQTLLRSALCCSRAEARGASFASLRRAGLRLARLKPVFSSVNCNYPSKSSGFYEFGLHSTLVDLRTNRTSFPSTFPRCRQLHIPVCRGVENNSKCTIKKQFVILRSRATKNL